MSEIMFFRLIFVCIYFVLAFLIVGIDQYLIRHKRISKEYILDGKIVEKNPEEGNVFLVNTTGLINNYEEIITYTYETIITK